MTGREIFTIGHSNQSIDRFVLALRSFRINRLVDVRAWPESRRYPHFGREALQEQLMDVDILYRWEGEALGGHRKTTPGAELHTAIPEGPFRNYAAHMDCDAFRDALGRVCRIAAENRVAIMCAERDPDHCHRSMIADCLVTGGWKVTHIIGPDDPIGHTLNESARREDDRLIYDRVRQFRLEGF